MELQKQDSNNSIFSGNIFIFYAFDIGEDLNLDAIKQSNILRTVPIALPRYFKNYHIPLAVELPDLKNSKCVSARIHHFGVIALTYQIPFRGTLEEICKKTTILDGEYKKQSSTDAAAIYNLIKGFTKQSHFFYLRSSYVVLQIDPLPTINVIDLKNKYGGLIASTLVFETTTLAETQKKEILDSSTGYYRGDLIIISTDAAFVYDEEYYEILDLFEFANIHKLELQYFDRLLDQRLNFVYEKRAITPPLSAYLPFITISDPIGDLERLKVDISVIAERLEGSIKLADEPYYTEIYTLLSDKQDLRGWKESIDKKLSIIKEIQEVYYNKIDVIREDLLSVLIIVLIFIEIIIGIIQK
jgi:hypothetical protein